MQDDRRFHAHSDGDFEPETEAFPEDMEDNFDEEEEEVSVSLSSDDDDIDDDDEEHSPSVGGAPAVPAPPPTPKPAVAKVAGEKSRKESSRRKGSG